MSCPISHFSAFHPDFSTSTSSLVIVNKTSSRDNEFASTALENSRAQLRGKSPEACGQSAWLILGDHICAIEHLGAMKRWSVADEDSVQLSKTLVLKIIPYIPYFVFPMTSLF